MNVLYNKMWANSQELNSAVWNVFWDVEADNSVGMLS